MDKLKYMQTFKMTVIEGSIAQAARTLGISKAAASKQLIELETKLNAQLLTRTGRRVQLTDTGQLFYESIKNIFALVDEAEAIVAHTHEKPIGTLRIASHRHFGEKYIIHHIKEFIDLYPGLKLDIELADRFPDLDKENIDILCGVSHEGPDHLVRRRISMARHILCASPAYLAKHGHPKKLHDLKKLHYITHSFRTPDNILLQKNNKEIHLDVSVRLNDAKAMLMCALEGLGFIKIFEYFVDDHLKNGTLVEMLKDHCGPPQPLYIFYKQQKFLPNKIRLFIDFLFKKVNSSCHSDNASQSNS
jgi:DNA-binding transcriptional LysR family regulator